MLDQWLYRLLVVYVASWAKGERRSRDVQNGPTRNGTGWRLNEAALHLVVRELRELRELTRNNAGL